MTVPRIIHFIYLVFDKPKMPPNWVKNLNSWKKMHPNFKIKLWSDSDALNLFNTHFPKLLNVYKNLKYNIQKADMLRYCILYTYGGVYCDLDLIPKHNIDTLLKLYEVDKKIEVGVAGSHFGGASNFMMFSKPGSKFWQDVLSFIKKNQSTYYITKTTQIMKQSGPLLLENIMESHKQTVVTMPVEILDSTSTCEQSRSTNFGYVINEHANSWVSFDGMLMKKFICMTSDFSSTPYYIFVLLIFIMLVIIIGIICKMRYNKNLINVKI